MSAEQATIAWVGSPLRKAAMRANHGQRGREPKGRAELEHARAGPLGQGLGGLDSVRERDEQLGAGGLLQVREGPAAQPGRDRL